ncbi:hypothetical protein LEN26_008760 [Aphanomyces euteiches]|nr:hypothetical protein AeMF1_005574 [Aphanomyces euteiches]KAH9130194.1 hypothetical protein LEN26_008760 [Aphanomyces euteiches]KAH9182317.1 hypothetical protein AeNC1_015708 [Aphanomyces euteiches]
MSFGPVAMDEEETKHNVEDLVPTEAIFLASERPRGKPGRKVADDWFILTADSQAHLQRTVTCVNCKKPVKTFKKVANLHRHLRKFPPFCKYMASTDPSTRPAWFMKTKTRRSTQDSMQQPTIQQHLVPPLSVADKKRFAKNLAMHYYMTGTSFARVEEKYLHEALSILRPDVAVPLRKDLSGYLLDTAYANATKQVKMYLNALAVQCVSIVSDVWTDVNGDPVVNYIVTTPTMSLFYEAIPTGYQSHNAIWIASDVERVIDSLQVEFSTLSVVRVVTDNTSTNKSAWAKLKTRYPSKHFYGCVSHALHLIVKNILSATKDDTIRSSPFTNLSLGAMALLSSFRTTTPKKQSWKSAKHPQSLLKSAEVLNSLTVNEVDFVTRGGSNQRGRRSEIKATVMDLTFKKNLEEVIAILSPVDQMIVRFQSDKVPMSEVVHDFNGLSNTYQQLPISKPKK